jgi:hypothetical protein
MPNSHDITALTRRVRDIFNKVRGQWSIACEMSALRIENAYYLLVSCMCDIFEREIVSKQIQNTLLNCEFETKRSSYLTR